MKIIIRKDTYKQFQFGAYKEFNTMFPWHVMCQECMKGFNADTHQFSATFQHAVELANQHLAAVHHG